MDVGFDGRSPPPSGGPSTGERAIRTREHHPDVEQELRRLGQHFRRSDHRDRDSGPAAAPLDDDQHPRRELSTEGAAAGWALTGAGAGR